MFSQIYRNCSRGFRIALLVQILRMLNYIEPGSLVLPWAKKLISLRICSIPVKLGLQEHLVNVKSTRAKHEQKHCSGYKFWMLWHWHANLMLDTLVMNSLNDSGKHFYSGTECTAGALWQFDMSVLFLVSNAIRFYRPKWILCSCPCFSLFPSGGC